MRKLTVAVPAVLAASLVACGGSGSMPAAAPASPAAADAAGASMDLTDPALAQNGAYVERDLVSDGAVQAEHTDANLVNAWGLDALPTTPWWVADNGKGVSTLYDGEGVAQPTSPGPLVVSLPGASGPAKPSGLVANPTADFVITMAGATGPARFLFASEDGTISAWMRTTPLSTQAVQVVPAGTEGAIFKGLALASTAGGSRLYATDFHNAVVRVYDGAFHELTLPPDAFHDGKLPAGFAPFGIRVIRGVVLVTYAQQDADAEDDVPGPGLGFVDAYSTGGDLLARIASGGKLNAPWGLALAPAGFGRHSHRLLVGNFGDGHVVSFGLHRDDGKDRGEHKDDLDDDGAYLRGAGGPVAIDGLWALSFGNDGPAGPATTLFFTAGPNGEGDGLFGRIDLAPGNHG